MTMLLIFAGIVLLFLLLVVLLICLSVSIAGRVTRIGRMVTTPMSCPRCACVMPKIRMPTSRRQAWWGGMTCPQCGLELDAKGRPLADP
mgnify:CR=1 FL=1